MSLNGLLREVGLVKFPSLYSHANGFSFENLIFLCTHPLSTRCRTLFCFINVRWFMFFLVKETRCSREKDEHRYTYSAIILEVAENQTSIYSIIDQFNETNM